MKLARVILFTAQMDAMSKFYGEILGLPQLTNEKGWREFAAGGHASRCIPARRHRAAKVPNCFLRERCRRPAQNSGGARRAIWQSPAGKRIMSLRWQRSRRQPHSIVEPLKLKSVDRAETRRPFSIFISVLESRAEHR